MGQVRRFVAGGAVALVAALAMGACVPDPGTVPPGDGTTTTTSKATTTSTTSTTTTSTTTTSTTTTTTIFENPEAGTSASYQIDPQHTGNTIDPTVDVAGLSAKWSVTLPGPASFPVIARGKVYAVAKTTASLYGVKLYAFDSSTGAEVWSSELAGSYWSGSVAYGSGRIIALNGDGVMRSFDAETGSLQWQQQMPGQYSFDAPITIVGNVIYATGSGSGGTMYAVHLATGGVKWTVGIGNGSKSAPAVDSTGIYVSHPCNTNKVSFSGTIVWTAPRACSGGGGKNVTLDSAAARLWVRQVSVPGDASFSSRIVNANTGTFGLVVPSGSPYAVWNGYGFAVVNGVLVKIDPSTGQQVWSMGADPGDTLKGAPIVLNGTVLVGGSSGKVYGIAATTGGRVLTTSLGATVDAIDEQNVSKPPTGWAAGGGIVAVSTTTGLAVLDN